MVSAEHEPRPISGSGGGAPQRVPGAFYGVEPYSGFQKQSPLVRGSGAKPCEAESFLAFGRQMEVTKFVFFSVFCGVKGFMEVQ